MTKPTYPPGVKGSGGGIAGGIIAQLNSDNNLKNRYQGAIKPELQLRGEPFPWITLKFPNGDPQPDSDRFLRVDQVVEVTVWEPGYDQCRHWGEYVDTILLSAHGNDSLLQCNGFTFVLVPDSNGRQGPRRDPERGPIGEDIYRFDFRYRTQVGKPLR